MILLIFTVTVLPISIAFYSDDQLKPAWLTINSLVDTLFMSDIVVNFRTGIFSADMPDEVSMQWVQGHTKTIDSRVEGHPTIYIC